MATMQEDQERHSPPPETARTELMLRLGLGPITATSSMVTAGDMAGGGGTGAGAGEVERAPEPEVVVPNKVRSSSPWTALLSVISLCSLAAGPEFQRKRRSYVLRRAAAPSSKSSWDREKLPVLPPAPPAPAKKKKTRARRKRAAKQPDMPCVLCEATETPLWRTWPTDGRVMLCNACGIKVRAPGVLLPELLYLSPPATAAATVATEPPKEIQPVSDSHSSGVALPRQVRVNLPPPPPATATTTAVVPELAPPAPEEIQPVSNSESPSPPDSPILPSMLDTDIYLLRRTSPRRENSPPPPPPPPAAAAAAAEPEPAAVVAAPAPPAPAPGQKKNQCLHCGSTSSRQWRTEPAGETTLCNPCGTRYKQGRLVPEYRPKGSPTFDPAKHSNKHYEVREIRRKLANPAPAATYVPIRPTKRRSKVLALPPPPPQPAQQGGKKRKGNHDEKEHQEQNQPAAQARPAPGPVAVLEVRKGKGKAKTQRRLLPPELTALLKFRTEKLKGKEQHRQPPQPAPAPVATQPREGNDMLQNPPPPPPPPPALPVPLPHAGYDMVPQLPPAPPRPADDKDPMAQPQLLPPPPPAQLHAGDELMIGGDGEPIPLPPPDPFLFDGPAAPMIIDDCKPVKVIVIDDD